MTMFFQRKTLWLPKDLGHDNEYQDLSDVINPCDDA